MKTFLYVGHVASPWMRGNFQKVHFVLLRVWQASGTALTNDAG